MPHRQSHIQCVGEPQSQLKYSTASRCLYYSRYSETSLDSQQQHRITLSFIQKLQQKSVLPLTFYISMGGYNTHPQ